jgi:hypothetical protein
MNTQISIAHTPAVHPEFLDAIDALRGAWCGRTRFGGGGVSPDQTGVGRVTVAIDVLDDLLGQLADRTGARADAARRWLEAERARLQAARAAFHDIGEDLAGDKYVSLLSELETVRAEYKRAGQALERCTDVAAIDALTTRREVARVRVNAARAALRELRDRAVLPALPALAGYRARVPDRWNNSPREVPNPVHPTVEIAERVASDNRELAAERDEVLALHLALDQARAADPIVARLWICSEPSGDRYAKRAQRYQAR